MLILTRKPGESLYIGDTIKITIVEIKGHQIRVGIEAPTELRIYREEIYLQILEENKQAAQASQVAEKGLEGLATALEGLKLGEGSKKLSSGKVPSAAGGAKSFSSLSASHQVGKDPQVVLRKKKKGE